MNWRQRQQYYSRDAREWGEFFGTWILLIAAWVLSTAGLGLLFKVMWKIFIFGWDLV